MSLRLDQCCPTPKICLLNVNFCCTFKKPHLREGMKARRKVVRSDSPTLAKLDEKVQQMVNANNIAGLVLSLFKLRLSAYFKALCYFRYSSFSNHHLRQRNTPKSRHSGTLSALLCFLRSITHWNSGYFSKALGQNIVLWRLGALRSNYPLTNQTRRAPLWQSL